MAENRKLMMTIIVAIILISGCKRFEPTSEENFSKENPITSTFEAVPATNTVIPTVIHSPSETKTPPPTKTLTSEEPTYTPQPTENDSPTPSPTLPPAITFPDHPSELGDTLIRPADGMRMVYVPGGTFEMGSLPDNNQFGPHTVTLDSFWIDQTEVTNAQYAALLNARGNQEKDGITWLEIEQIENAQIEIKDGIFQPETGKANHPAVEISWHGAAAYCEWVGARLPTEAEWEYAARGPENYVYPWGNYPPTCDLAQFGGCGDVSVPVGSLSEEGDSWVGAKDMAGNVWERTADYYAEYPTEPQTNPTGPESGEWWKKVVRGGSYLSAPDTLHTAYRLHGGGNQPNIGFRCATSTPNATEPLPEEMGEIRTFLEKIASNDQFSGTVLIAQGNVPILQAAYGLADQSNEIPNQIDTKFNLGSMDKMFTAVAILQLVERGEISLQDMVGDYLPDYANAEVKSTVSIHQLLTHTSGMGNYFDSPLYEDIHSQIRSVADYLPLFINTPLQFQPGARFGYSNSGYIVLGLIIEEVTSQSYYDYVRKNIFEPSGMLDTACYELDASTPNLAIGYTSLDWYGNETGQITDNNFVMPMRGGSAGGGYSTAPDMHAFANALLRHQLLSPESTELLMKGKVALGEDVQYAYGFFDRTVKGYRIVGHGGGFPGICSIFGMNLDLGYTTVILSNSDDDCMTASDFIMETLLK